MKPIVIIADDLTGACDTGVKFQEAGFDTRVITTCENLDIGSQPENIVISINTASRALSPEDAQRSIRDCLKTVCEKSECCCYKKVDSLLRGNVCYELEGVFDALSPQFVLLTPAYPQNGRVVKEGMLRICTGSNSGEAINALELLRRDSGRSCALLGEAVIQQGIEAVCTEIEKLLGNGAGIILADAETQEQLDTLAEVVVRYGNRCVPAGSAGLAQSLAERLSNQYRQEFPEPVHPSGIPLLVVGTRHPVTVKQVQFLREHLKLRTCIIKPENLSEENLADMVQKATAEVPSEDEYEAILLTTDEIYLGMTGECKTLFRNDHNDLILKALALAAKEIVDREEISELVLTGGDVALAVMEGLTLKVIRLLDEAAPGIVRGFAEKSEGGFLLATKSGGFGGTSALIEILSSFCPANISA